MKEIKPDYFEYREKWFDNHFKGVLASRIRNKTIWTCWRIGQWPLNTGGLI